MGNRPQSRLAELTMRPKEKRDDHWKRVIHEATNGGALLEDEADEVMYGPALVDKIDATFRDVAIEAAPDESKKVSGALLNLICHPYPRKLLILLPPHKACGSSAGMSEAILSRLCRAGSYRVVLLNGGGEAAHFAGDAAIVAAALRALTDG